MAEAEISNLRGAWSSGNLVIEDTSANAVLTIYASSGGFSITNGGGLTVSSGVTITGGGLSISSGRLALGNQKTKTVAASATLTASSCGVVCLVTASDVVITLPGAASTGIKLFYTIVNTLTTAGQCVIKTTDTTSEIIVGGGIVNSTGYYLLANTGATHVCGDYVKLANAVASTSWSIFGMAGTWASAT